MYQHHKYKHICGVLLYMGNNYIRVFASVFFSDTRLYAHAFYWNRFFLYVWVHVIVLFTPTFTLHFFLFFVRVDRIENSLLSVSCVQHWYFSCRISNTANINTSCLPFPIITRHSVCKVLANTLNIRPSVLCKHKLHLTVTCRCVHV